MTSVSAKIAVPASSGLRETLRRPLPHLAGDRITRGALRGVVAVFGPFVEVVHAERLAQYPEPAIYALNHNNSVESLVVPSILFFLRGGRRIHFLIDWMYLHLAPVAPLLRLSGGIPVFTKPARFRLRDGFRRQGLRGPSPLERARACLEAGRSVGLFPEGTRNPDPHRLLPGRRGLGCLALETGVPVIPIGIDFPGRKRLGRIPKLGRIRLTVGTPMCFEAEHRASETRRKREMRIVRRVMQELSPLCGKRPFHNEEETP